MNRSSTLQELFSGLRTERDNFREKCSTEICGIEEVRDYTLSMASILEQGLSRAGMERDGWFLARVGGFGRGELGFLSDLDLLFLYTRSLSKEKKAFVRELVSGFWDAGFEVGHSVMSVSGLNKLSREDFSVLTTNLTSEFLFGDAQFYDSWRKDFVRDAGPRQKKRLLQRLIEYRNSRYRQYGNSIYMLEPNIKEGLGGLRDIHSLRWTGILTSFSPDFEDMVLDAWLDRTEKHWLEDAEDFLWKVRLQLHGIQGKKRDKLVLSAQEEIANRLGFGGESMEAVSPVEGFMRNYYKHSARIRRVTDFVLEKLSTYLQPANSRTGKNHIIAGDFVLQGSHIRFYLPSRIKHDPGLLMHIFWYAAKYRAHFHHETGQIIRENLHRFTPKLGQEETILGEFFDILLDPQMAFHVLKTMLETGFLEVFLPEFAPIRYKVQYDVYHLYTVDEHLLRTVKELHAMDQGEEEDESTDNFLHTRELFSRISNRKVLYLAALIHDVGKGKGKGHARRGAELVLETGRRLGLNEDEVDLLAYLVENHLLLAETALKRDLSEEKPIETCALKVGNVQRLSMLYLLTVADSKATGGQVWNSWRKALIRELFIKVRNFLEKNEWENRDINYKASEKKDIVHKKLEPEVPGKKISSWLDKLSLRYLLNQSAEDIVVHYFLEQELKQSKLKINVKSLDAERWEFVLVCRERPNLFDYITGVLWVNGINILSADIYTRDYGVALDILIVDQIPDPLNPKRVWDRVERDLEAVLNGDTSLEELKSRQLSRNLLRNRLVVPTEDNVVINEQASDFFTVIEVYTWERSGVLHAISRVLHSFDLSIKSAKITTPGAQVVDVFYVTDNYGGKIMDENVHSRISSELLSTLKEV